MTQAQVQTLTPHPPAPVAEDLLSSQARDQEVLMPAKLTGGKTLNCMASEEVVERGRNFSQTLTVVKTPVLLRRRGRTQKILNKTQSQPGVMRMKIYPRRSR